MSVVLWHIPISHFSEKVRWALDYKGIEARHRATVPPVHIGAAFWLTRGAQHTFPVLQLDGTTIGDSTAIIAALEEFQPEPALYPAESDDRRRALALEDLFDESLGPAMRMSGWQEIVKDDATLQTVTGSMLPGRVAGNDAARGAISRFAKLYVGLRYDVGDDDAAERARADVLVALDRLEAELDSGAGTYLVGDAFSVADLTAASLLYPLVGPPEGPQIGAPPGLIEFRDGLLERRGYGWVREMFARHRVPALPAV